MGNPAAEVWRLQQRQERKQAKAFSPVLDTGKKFKRYGEELLYD